jgi:beta-phosphoglucomutase
MGVKAFVFDLDGVLTETSEQHYLAWKALVNGMGMDFDREFNENLKGVSRIESLERILVHCGREKDFTSDEKLEMADWKNEIYKEMIKNITPEDLFDGILEVLKELKAKGIKIAIGSVSKNAPAIIHGLGIENYVDYIVDVNRVKKGKPAPDIFLDAAERFGLKPEECIGIEDAEVGIEAIKAAGMFAVGVGTADKMYAADIVFDCPQKLDLEKMRRAAAYLVGSHDFAAFAGSPCTVKTTVRTVYSIEITGSGSLVQIDVVGSGFLYNMVRIIAGTLLYVGIGKLQVEDMPSILESGDRRRAGITAKPQGLFLVEVRY